MSQKPSPGVEHTLVIYEPFTPSMLPAANCLGLICRVEVCYPDLEESINLALGRAGRISFDLELCQLVPDRSLLFEGIVHLVSTGVSLDIDLRKLIDDYHTYVEPERRKFLDRTVFRDDANRHPSISTWPWGLRRAAYYHLYEPQEEWLRLAAQLDDYAEQFLSRESANEPNIVDRLFTSLAALTLAGERQAAAEIRHALQLWRRATAEPRSSGET